MDEPDRARRLIALLEAAEETYPYVSLERIRRLARSRGAYDGSTRGLAGWVRAAVAEGLLLSDSRLRLTADGRFEPVQIYRLNRRHPVVARALDDQPE